MDIFDTFFLVEFLRQWAATAGSSGPAAITPSGKFAVITTPCMSFKLSSLLPD
jgi:hypothetical protein